MKYKVGEKKLIDLSTYLKCNDIKDFAVGIEHGCFYWKVELNDNKIYQIKYRIEKYKTAKGNYSRRKVYFIRKDDRELIFDDEVNKWFKSFRYPYIRCGI